MKYQGHFGSRAQCRQALSNSPPSSKLRPSTRPRPSPAASANPASTLSNRSSVLGYTVGAHSSSAGVLGNSTGNPSGSLGNPSGALGNSSMISITSFHSSFEAGSVLESGRTDGSMERLLSGGRVVGGGGSGGGSPALQKKRESPQTAPVDKSPRGLLAAGKKGRVLFGYFEG